MRKIFLSSVLALIGFCAGFLAAGYVYTQTQAGAGDQALNDLGSTIGALYESSGDQRSIGNTRDILALNIANSFILAATSARTITDDSGHQRLDNYVNFILEHDLLNDVKEPDAKKLASAIAECWKNRSGSLEVFDECVEGAI